MTRRDPDRSAYTEMGNAAVRPISWKAFRTVAETVRWGSGSHDRARIAAYYLLRLGAGMFRGGHDVVSGMYPNFWIGDVVANTPIGTFACRARTIDFEIVNPRYEAIEVDTFRTRISERTSNDTCVCVDVGAHIGKFSILAGRLLRGRGRVLAVEPEPSNFAALTRNIALNRLPNVEAIQAACGATDGVQHLSLSTTNIGAHTLQPRDGAARVPVMVHTLDRLLQGLGMDRLDVLKLDVEYHEAEVLQGARRVLESNPRVSIFFEETSNPREARSCAFLRSLGFEPTRLAGNIYMAERPRP